MAPVASLLLLLAALPGLLATPTKQVAFNPSDKWLVADPDTAERPHTHPSDTRERFDGHQVWRIDYSSMSATGREQFLSLMEETNIGDIWRTTKRSMDVRVSPENSLKLPTLLQDSNLTYTQMVPNLQHLIDSTAPHFRDRETPPTDTPDGWNVSSLDTRFYDAYQPLEAMWAFGSAIADHWPEYVTGLELGRTEEGRAIRGWSAKLPMNEGEKDPKVEFLIQSGQHAREWVGPASALYFLHSLLLDATANPKSKAAIFLRTFTVTVVPMLNPDGYVYSYEHNRMWKKNRQNVGGLLCKGIDLNGNWGYQYRPSRLACSENYAGQTAFEAHETSAMANYLINGTVDSGPRDKKIKAYVDLHSYGQLFMFPFAYSCEEFPADAENLMEAGLGVAKAIRMTDGVSYQTGQACDLTYRYAGDSMDYAYAVADVRWAYSAELRDTGTYGFMLPPDLIRPTGDDVTAGLRYLAQFIDETEIDI